MSGVLFVVMPFCGIESPQLSVSLLKGQLRTRGIPSAIAYLNFPFAEAAGRTAYGRMKLQSCLAGEWMFGRSLFSRRGYDQDGYLRYLEANHFCTPEVLNVIRRLAGLVEPFLDHCLRVVDWERYSIIGFTSTFEQNVACLALAKRVKERYPNKIIVMGGGNCADVMGVQLHKSFPFLDYVFTSEADFSFPELVSRLGNGDGRRDDIPGHVRREGRDSVAIPEGRPLDTLDALAYPDFDDYFAAYRMSSLRYNLTPMMQMETSRGCWWGAKHHCTFCGLNQNGMVFRGKSPQRAMDEVTHLVSRYGMTKVFVVDNIISMDYFATFLPDLKRRHMDLELFYETKANLKKEQVKLFSDAGVRIIQPGIESFSTNVLTLMRKGVSPLQNVQVLKFCRENVIHPMWNVLFGFPGEKAADYEEMCDIAQNLSHLTPPVYCIPVEVQRFSPYFNFAAELGIRNIRAHALYKYVYPFDDSVLNNIAYSFDADFDGKENIEAWSEGIRALVAWWTSVHSNARLEVVSRTPEITIVQDTRPNAVHSYYTFGARESAVIDACDRIQTLPDIIKRVRQAMNGSMPEEAWIRNFVRYLSDRRLVQEHEGRYLSLILPEPKPLPRPDTWPVFSN
jgi:ribosomal peptide maturation radical SAM protein 1